MLVLGNSEKTDSIQYDNDLPLLPNPLEVPCFHMPVFLNSFDFSAILKWWHGWSQGVNNDQMFRLKVMSSKLFIGD